MLNEIFSGDAVWAIATTVLIPTLGGLWWYTLSKISHLYSKIALINATLAERGAMIHQSERYSAHIASRVSALENELHSQENEINFLYWELSKDKPYEQSKQAKRPSDR